MVSPPPLPTFEWVSTANFCMNGSDTLIAGMSFTRLSDCAGGYVGAIRQDTGAVYFQPADSAQAYLLYDFGVSMGDTLRDVYVNELLGTGTGGWMNADLIDLVVTSSAPSTNYDGRIEVQGYALDLGMGTDFQWVEGIGSIHGLFTLNPLNVSGYWYGIHCMSHRDTVRWEEGAWFVNTPGSCSPQYVGIAEEAGAPFSVYPNPTTGTVFVDAGEQRIEEVRISDTMGRTEPILLAGHATLLALDLGDRATGLYMLHLRSGRSWSTERLLLKDR
ncbi:MAG: T9SS type A sorting domain-containing protein, partial [Flavobacteriales bacterium]|nr:T9SS type A sorting domain-containing protein [Flavobacteriales bacterium]